MGQIHCQLWVTWEVPARSRPKLWDQLVADLCKLMGTQKIWTSLYHPQTNGQCERFNPTLIGMLGMLPPEKKSEWKNHIRTLVHAYNCTQNSATGFSPYYLMYGRQPHLPKDVTLGLAPCTTTVPNTSKFVHKMREHAKWAQKKAEAFQAKEAQCHKKNYDKLSKADTLEVGDTVLVHVPAFKGCHKIQNRWENREYVVQELPYPDVPVYVVCPMDGGGHRWTLHRNYLLPFNSNIGQDEKEAPMAGVENTSPWTQAPPVDSEPANVGPSVMVMSSAAGSIPQGSLDQPAPLRCGTWKTQNKLPWRYQNFSLQVNTRPPSIWDTWAGLHAILSLYNVFCGSTVWIHSIHNITCLWSTTHFGIEGNSFNVVSVVDFWMVGEWTKDYLSQIQLPHQRKNSKEYPYWDPRSVQQPHWENQTMDVTKSNNTSPDALCDKWNYHHRKVYWGVILTNVYLIGDFPLINDSQLFLHIPIRQHLVKIDNLLPGALQASKTYLQECLHGWPYHFFLTMTNFIIKRTQRQAACCFYRSNAQRHIKWHLT